MAVGKKIDVGVFPSSNDANEMHFALDVNMKPGINADQQDITIKCGNIRVDTYKEINAFGTLSWGETFGLLYSELLPEYSDVFTRDIGYTVSNVGTQYVIESKGYIYSYVTLGGITAEEALEHPEIFRGTTFFNMGLNADDINIELDGDENPWDGLFDGLFDWFYQIPWGTIIMIAAIILIAFIQ
jgi:hypothetical protein